MPPFAYRASLAGTGWKTCPTFGIHRDSQKKDLDGQDAERQCWGCALTENLLFQQLVHRSEV